MSRVTVSTKRNRVYARKFDHDVARELREQGVSYAAIADQFGVSPMAVRRVCNPAVNERLRVHSAARLERNRTPCLGGCGTLVWPHGRTGYCNACLREERDAGREDIRADELQCRRCRQWKPDADFGPARNHSKQYARRGLHTRCRACETEIRGAHRSRKPQLQQESDRRSSIAKRRHLMTGWIVLRTTRTGFEKVTQIDAVSATHAIESAVTEPGEYCAVKERDLKVFRVGQVQAFRVLPEIELAEASATG